MNCLCSSSTNQGLFTCLECALSLEPDTALMSQAQESLAGERPSLHVRRFGGLNPSFHRL